MGAMSGLAPTVGRLTRSEEYQGLRRGKRIETRFGQARAMATPRVVGEASLRVGLIVPKKLGNAPRRNRIKRRLRAGFADARLTAELGDTSLVWTDETGKTRGIDIGVFPSQAVLDMNFDTLVTQLGGAVRALARKLRAPSSEARSDRLLRTSERASDGR